MSAAANSSLPVLRWDLFCRVVDNFGDIGVSWRLAAELARRGQRVRLWIDDPAALAWMAPGGQPGVECVAWHADTAAADPGDVVVETFGCDPPPAFVAALAARAAQGRPAVWLNLEYLSAEAYVERSHRLASPQMSGPGRGLVKWFYYPGFTAATGGLLREPGLMATMAAFDRSAWLQSQGLALQSGEGLASLFCYPSAPLTRLLDALGASGRRWCLAAAPGPACEATRQAIAAGQGAGRVRLHALPWLSQADYDRLLWSTEFNLVRGEDSFVRAQWAGRPFLWHIYPQADGAHAAKLDAFLDRALAPLDDDPESKAAWRRWHHLWNGLDDRAALAAPEAPAPDLRAATLKAMGHAARQWRLQLIQSEDLVTQLFAFVLEKR